MYISTGMNSLLWKASTSKPSCWVNINCCRLLWYKRTDSSSEKESSWLSVLKNWVIPMMIFSAGVGIDEWPVWVLILIPQRTDTSTSFHLTHFFLSRCHRLPKPLSMVEPPDKTMLLHKRLLTILFDVVYYFTESIIWSADWKIEMRKWVYE